jgi:predicted O-methyltransferase YrrM
MVRHLINHILAGTSHVLRDPRVEMTLERLYADGQRAADTAARRWSAEDPYATEQLGDYGFSLRPVQGELLYLLCRATAASRVITVPASGGAATLYCAAALRDLGGGVVISCDPRGDMIEGARQNVVQAGLEAFVELRQGDPVEVLEGPGGPVDLAYIDGWPALDEPSGALRILEALEPNLRPGALVLNEGQEPDYLDHVRGPGGRFRTSVLELGVLSMLT